MAPVRKPQAVLYARQSDDNQRSTDEQDHAGTARAEAEGWRIAATYRDGVSASRHSRKQRPDWARLLAHLKRPEPTVLWMWETSRGDRTLTSWSAMLDTCREQGVRIYVETHGRLYDMGNARDWRTLAEDGVDNAYESEKTSLRCLRTAESEAVKGKPSGMTPYGFTRSYDPKTGKFSSQDPHPVEAPVVAELVRRLHAGHSLRSIARDFADRGVRGRSGHVVKQQQWRHIALNPAVAGYRQHGRQRYDAVWAPLVPRATWHTVEDTLTDDSRKTYRHGRAHHLLSGIVVCGVCDGVLRPLLHKGTYQCHAGGHVVVNENDLDAHVELVLLGGKDPATGGRVAGYLQRSDVYEQLTAGRVDDAELGKVRDDLADARGELRHLQGDVRSGRLSVRHLAEVAPGIEDRIARLGERETELSTPPALAGLITPGKDVRRRWRAAPISTRREVARMLLTVDLLGQVRVTRSPIRGHAVPAAERVVWRREDGDHHG